MQLVAWLGVVGIGFLYRGYRKFRVHRLVQDMATSSIESAAQGLVEVSGRALCRGGAAVVDFRGVPCIFVSYEIQKEGRATWWTLSRGSLGERFILEDDSGLVHVFLKNADLHMDHEDVPWDEVPPQIRERFRQSAFRSAWVEWSNLWPARWMRLMAPMRVVQKRLDFGVNVYVLGTFQTRSQEPEVEYFDLAGRVHKGRPRGGLLSRSPHPLIIAKGSEKELLHRVSMGTLSMVFGSFLIATAFALASML